MCSPCPGFINPDGAARTSRLALTPLTGSNKETSDDHSNRGHEQDGWRIRQRAAPDYVKGRVVEGQRLMQAASDIMLGWFRTPGVDGVERDFYIRQLWDGKGSALVELMEPNALAAYAEICGSTLARAHARSGDAVAIAAYLGSGDTFDRALTSFAEDYADQNNRDYAAFRAAIDSGRLVAETGLDQRASAASGMTRVACRALT